jgi:hypothetical protein
METLAGLPVWSVRNSDRQPSAGQAEHDMNANQSDKV